MSFAAGGVGCWLRLLRAPHASARHGLGPLTHPALSRVLNLAGLLREWTDQSFKPGVEAVSVVALLQVSGVLGGGPEAAVSRTDIGNGDAPIHRQHGSGAGVVCAIDVAVVFGFGFNVETVECLVVPCADFDPAIDVLVCMHWRLVLRHRGLLSDRITGTDRSTDAHRLVTGASLSPAIL